ncbi:hypothetical protein CEXT_796411 [Caerostris extrusa]|uniref:Uncharacterized protein n=1 Tax=Caerostris extrusa TaxID=172846 RepID=A0AAV4VHT8_CAEEX|nr:hypothetical protein CEXT_796411 [Caerostris extrusa]
MSFSLFAVSESKSFTRTEQINEFSRMEFSSYVRFIDFRSAPRRHTVQNPIRSGSAESMSTRAKRFCMMEFLKMCKRKECEERQSFHCSGDLHGGRDKDLCYLNSGIFALEGMDPEERVGGS